MTRTETSAAAIYLDLAHSNGAGVEKKSPQGILHSQAIIDSLMPAYGEYMDIMRLRKLTPDEWMRFKEIAAEIAENIDVIKLLSSTSN